MTDILEELASRCRTILGRDSGPAGRDEVAALLAELLQDPQARDTLVPADGGERELLYRDPELGFCILAHNYPGPKASSPHDHGPSWAIYAQARGDTEMSDFEMVTPADGDRPGTVRATRTYRLSPGDAHVYNEGDLHAPKRTGPTSLLRIEGTDMSKVSRLRYEAV